jgi:hypothetical protein
MADYRYSLLNTSTNNKRQEITEVEGTMIGQTFQQRAVILSPKDRQSHIHCIGSTGTGKSKFIELMIRQDLLDPDRPHGFCLIDPHGKLYDELLLYIAHGHPEVADRLILFNPAGETNNVLGFNPLQKVLNPDGSLNLDDLDYRIGTLVSGCLKVWGQYDGGDKSPRISRWLENIFYTLLVNGLSLVEAAALISTKENPAREKMLEKVSNFLIDEDWKAYQSSNFTMKQTQLEGAANRLRRFLSSEVLRNILGQQENVLDFKQVMDEGKIVLVNLSSQGKLYSENLRLLGVMFVNEIFRVAQLRDYKNPDLKPFYLYIDEFGKFVTRDIASMLEETRKFKVFCILAHQHLEQLKKEDEYLYASVMTNCKTKVVFGDLSVKDSQIMAEQISMGYLPLDAIKDQMEQTKIRHNEETRVTRSQNVGLMEGQNWSNSQTIGVSYAEQHSIAKQVGESLAISSSDTTGESVQYSEGRQIAEGLQISQGVTQAIGKQLTRGFCSSEMTGGATAQNWSQSQQESLTESVSKGQTRGQNQGISTGSSETKTVLGEETTPRSTASGKSLQEQMGTSLSESLQKGTSKSLAIGNQKGGSTSNNYAHTDSQNVSLGDSVNTALSNQIGKNLQISSSEQKGVSFQKSHTDGVTVTQNQSTTTSDSETHSISLAEGNSKGGSTGYSVGYTESITPFLAPEEYKEVTSRTFWTIDELQYIFTSAMKNQQTGECFIKTVGSPPMQVKVENVPAIEYDPFISPVLLDNTRDLAFYSNKEYFPKSTKTW